VDVHGGIDGGGSPGNIAGDLAGSTLMLGTRTIRACKDAVLDTGGLSFAEDDIGLGHRPIRFARTLRAWRSVPN
jgi:hypothetical protein